MTAKKRYLLRIDPQLYDALQRWASDELRSVNAQMEFLLSDAVRRAGRQSRQQPETAAEGGSEDDDGPDSASGGQ